MTHGARTELALLVTIVQCMDSFSLLHLPDKGESGVRRTLNTNRSKVISLPFNAQLKISRILVTVC